TFTSHVPHVPTRAYVRERMEEIFYDPSLVTSEWVESIRRIVTTRRTALRVLQVARAAKRHNVEERLSQVRGPTLLVWGKDDRITPSDVAERFHARIRGSQLVYLPNCGHAPMLERPEAFNAAGGHSSRPVPAARSSENARDRTGRRRGAPRLPGAPPPRARGCGARRRPRAGVDPARSGQLGPRDRVRTVASPRANPLRRRLSGADAAGRLPALSAALDAGHQRRTRSHLAGAASLLGEDVGHHRGRQDDSGDPRGRPRSSEGRLRRGVDRR